MFVQIIFNVHDLYFHLPLLLYCIKINTVLSAVPPARERLSGGGYRGLCRHGNTTWYICYGHCDHWILIGSCRPYYLTLKIYVGITVDLHSACDLPGSEIELRVAEVVQLHPRTNRHSDVSGTSVHWSCQQRKFSKQILGRWTQTSTILLMKEDCHHSIVLGHELVYIYCAICTEQASLFFFWVIESVWEFLSKKQEQWINGPNIVRVATMPQSELASVD